MRSYARLSERQLLFLIGSVQFINVLDFMMVMPLGPDFAQALGIETAQLGIVGGAYTAAAAVSGLLGSLFLDRYDRRQALACSLTGLVLGTAMGGLAWDLSSLIVARVVAGAFGGPATAISMAIVADVIPPERRARAVGAVMGAFSVASVFGVPFGLELARFGGWQLPFFAVAALGAVVTSLATTLMPPLKAHIAQAQPAVAGILSILRRPTALLSLSTTACAMFGMFAIVPNLSAYFQVNLGYPRARLGVLYLIGGSVSFLTMRLSGRIADRFGSARTAALGTSLLVGLLLFGFVREPNALPVLALFVLFMVTSSFRMVALQGLASRVPEPHERARFLSVQSCVQHVASASGAMLAAGMLTTLPGGGLLGMDHVALLTASTAAMVPLLMVLVERRVRQRELALRAQAAELAPAPVRA